MPNDFIFATGGFTAAVITVIFALFYNIIRGSFPKKTTHWLTLVFIAAGISVAISLLLRSSTEDTPEPKKAQTQKISSTTDKEM